MSFMHIHLYFLLVFVIFSIQSAFCFAAHLKIVLSEFVSIMLLLVFTVRLKEHICLNI